VRAAKQVRVQRGQPHAPAPQAGKQAYGTHLWEPGLPQQPQHLLNAVARLQAGYVEGAWARGDGVLAPERRICNVCERQVDAAQRAAHVRQQAGATNALLLLLLLLRRRRWRRRAL
jgi:hypothetical protein